MSEQQKNEAMYFFATIDSLTERGGRVTEVTAGVEYCGKELARVGDIVTYDDGSKAIIIDGAGDAAVCVDKPLALVGSRLSNGDRIVKTGQEGFSLTVRDDETIPGLFDPAYVPPLGDAKHEGT
jgi:uncharacterized Zn-binding protein involved in type VI secretion